MKSCIVALVVCLSAFPLSANCLTGLQAPAVIESGSQYDVTIVPAQGKHYYTLVESWGLTPFTQESQSRVAFVTIDPTLADAARILSRQTRSHRATFDMNVKYRLTAVSDINQGDACTAEITVLVKGDPELKRTAARGIIPVVGATAGVNGAQFKTSLKLIGVVGMSGRLVFHPIDQPGRDSDPSMHYSFANNDPLIFDDVMASLGATGVGSLDVIPENDSSFPDAETRVYNEAANGTFGTLVPLISAGAWMQLDLAPRDITPPAVSIPQVSAGLRLNVGVRTITAIDDFNVSIVRADGRHEGRTLHLAADTLIMAPPEQLIGAEPLRPGDQVGLSFRSGEGIPFYTLTDNRTNDPAIYVPPRHAPKLRFAD